MSVDAFFDYTDEPVSSFRFDVDLESPPGEELLAKKIKSVLDGMDPMMIPVEKPFDGFFDHGKHLGATRITRG